jgi:LysM repeat protein
LPGRSNIRTTQDTLKRDINSRISNLQSDIKSQAWYKRFSLSNSSSRKFTRYGLLGFNLILLAIVVGFVLQKPKVSGTSVSNAVLVTQEEAVANPIDSLSSADIALNVARVSNLSEKVSVENLADTVNAQLTITPADDIVVAQPQIISTGLKSRADIEFYKVLKGDNVANVAEKFDITSDTIKWSNTLTGNDLTVGQTLVISPVNGIVYRVKQGDTIASVASRYRVNKEKFIAFNDLESGKLPVGQRVVLPDGKPPVASAPSSSGFSPTRLLWGGGGGYDPGWCTWYAAAKAGVPGGWGNANTWHLYAPLSGWTVSGTPRVGAVAQNSSGWAGHVGIVEAVSPDGKMIKYSDMNGLAGFNRVGYSDWVPVHGKYSRFIYR